VNIEPLYGFQRDAINRGASGEPVYLGFDPGLGKSRTGLEIAKKRNSKSVLVIAPASGRYVWERECRKWWPDMPFRMVHGIANVGYLNSDGIVMITYGLLSLKDGPFAGVVAKRAKPFDVTILDEAAAVKNSGANRTRAILGKMLPKLGYVIPLSGTPAPNHAGELYPILKALFPQAIKDGSGRQLLQWQFEDRFCHVVRKRFGTGAEVRVIEGSRNLPELRKRIAPFMIRVRKEDVLKDLPPVRYDVVPLQVRPTALPSLPAGLSDEALLKYLSGASGDEAIMRLRRLLGIAKTPSAVEYIDDFLENLPKPKKLLVFAHHREVIEKLAEGLINWSPAVITGASTPAERQGSIDRFLGVNTAHPTSLLIGNIQAAGTGLTLVGPHCACSDVIFVEATYSVGDNVQAACRVHRIGQKEAVVARFLTAHGTIDDRIQAILARKAKDFGELFQ
jgi:SWI/SNF-related matrix-associated actin-dependent regulator 1 of chromatin subfamily A